MWAQLYQAGYVTTRDTGRPNDDTMPRRLYVPNLEVGRLYGKELLARATRLAGSEARLRALHRAVVACDATATRDALRRILLDAASYHDLTGEASYHVLVLALLYAVDGYRPATSDRESGDGRCDVLPEPMPSEAGRLPAHAMELKVDKSAQTDDELLARARRRARPGRAPGLRTRPLRCRPRPLGRRLLRQARGRHVRARVVGHRGVGWDSPLRGSLPGPDGIRLCVGCAAAQVAFPSGSQGGGYLGGITGTPLGTTSGVCAGQGPAARVWFTRGWVLGWNSGYPARNFSPRTFSSGTRAQPVPRS